MCSGRITGADLFDLFTLGDDEGESKITKDSQGKRSANDLDRNSRSAIDNEGSDEGLQFGIDRDLSLINTQSKANKRLKTEKGAEDTFENPVLADEVEQQVELAFKVAKDPELDTSEDQSIARPSGEPVIRDDPVFTQQVSEKDDKNGDFGRADQTGASKEGSESRVLITHQIRHQVALPPKWSYVPINDHVPFAEPAHKFPFKLDPFQRTSIYSIEKNESVLVSAHTSAGKTVIAEYAIALSLRNKQRVIYTSPIKALSNQKYREFSHTFGDVGLMTGDVTINPGAGCVVMTTEILRSMLYRGSDINREVAWIIFDEIHYMRDTHRGVVWEETIIMLPDTVRYVFLSATVPNAIQFAEWICKIHKQPCHVVYTDFRPTPLQHYIFPSGKDGIYLAVDEKGAFLEDNFQRAISSLDNDTSKNQVNKFKQRGNAANSSKGRQADLVKIIKLIMRRNYYPVIVFSFSKRECEYNAKQLMRFDLNTEEQKEMVNCIFTNAISTLNDDEKQLPQIVGLLPLLQRGIALHHSGLLPLVREAIEILFQEGLIKVLFATETFSIGLNMPARTVIFTSLRKWDGKEARWITSGEYIQMSGRAGRRGLDDRGIVILMLDEKIEPHVARGILKGLPDPFNSAFYLSYSMLLNLLRVDCISPEKMLERSFFQFQAYLKLPKVEREFQIYKSRLNAINVPDEELVVEYYEIILQIEEYKKEMHKILVIPENCLKFIQPGRFARVKIRDYTKNQLVDYGWGIILGLQMVTPKHKKKYSNIPEAPKHIVFVCLYCAPGSGDKKYIMEKKDQPSPEPCSSKEPNGEVLSLPCTLDSIYGLSPVMIKFNYELKIPEQRKKLASVIREIGERFPDGLEELDYINTMGIKDEKFIRFDQRLKVLETRLMEHPLHKRENKETLIESYKSKLSLMEKIKEIGKEVRVAQSAVQLHELKHRRRVLRRLEYTSSKNLIEMKGRVACEISAGDELLITEMIFEGVFNDLSVEQTVALLSCFTFQEKSDGIAVFPDDLEPAFRQLQEHARRITRISQECKILIDEEEYVQSFRPELMEITYCWCKGATFNQICMMKTDIFEGSIIRAIKRLEELLRQLIIAAKNIGNTSLENKFADGIVRIKRDIISSASLYL